MAIDDKALAAIAALKHLESLTLEDAAVSGDGLKQLADLPLDE